MLRSQTRKAAINEIYPSIQGEGLLVGTPSLFIRIQGCNIRCPWCDQPSALAFKEPSIDFKDLMEIVDKYPHKHVVITGGEPFTETFLPELVKELLKKGKSVQIETNGTLWNQELEDVAEHIHITCSPKAAANWYVHPKIKEYAKELKFVVDEVLNLEVIFSFGDFLDKGCVVLQPEGNKKEFIDKALGIQLKLLELGYEVRLLPQVHKLIGLR